MGTFSIWHWLIVLLIIVLIFGTKKLRNIGSDLGGAVKEFKGAMREDEDEDGKTPKNGRTIEGKVSSKTQTNKKKSNTHV